MRAASALQVHYADRRELAGDFVARFVTAADRQRCEAIAHPRRRAECLAGRALLRYALEQFTGASAQSHDLRATSEGKPVCEGGPAISLSHSGDIVVCAVSADGEVGVDVETRTPRTHAATLAAQHFTSYEAAWIEADPDPRFQMLWVLKEAYLKALGVGLAGGLRSLECRIEPPSIDARVATGGAAPQLELYVGQECFLGIALHDAPRRAIRITRCAPRAAADACGPFELMAATP